MSDPYGKPPTPHRRLRFVDITNYKDFWRKWKAIDRLWQPLTAPREDWDVIASLRRAAFDELRSEFRAVVNIGPAVYPIVV